METLIHEAVCVSATTSACHTTSAAKTMNLLVPHEAPVRAGVVSSLREGDSVTAILSVLNTNSAVQTMRPSAPPRIL